jgi:TatD DNase family protein
LIDTHAHLYMDSLGLDVAGALARAWEAGLRAIINVGIDLETSRDVLQLSRQEPRVFAAMGLHPTTQTATVQEDLREIEALIRSGDSRVVAVGEIGLDYYWKKVPFEEERSRLELQLDMALRLGLPVILHCRDALDDLFTLLEKRQARPPGVLHCFSGGAQEVFRAVALGFHVSFAGNVTYPKATVLREAALATPANRLLVETDAPFLSPQARRGQRNEPSFVRHTLDFLAELRGVSPGELEEITDQNARGLFGL